MGCQCASAELAAALVLLPLLALVAPAAAIDDTEKELEKYRQMLKADPWSNPGLLDADRGEALWKQKRGPKNASLEQCDLGKGPGKVEGAFAELPRYFKDADRVLDLESRLVWCMETLQGFARAEIVKRPYSKANQAGTELEALATYVAFKSNGAKFAPQSRACRRRRRRWRSARRCSSAARVRWTSPARPATATRASASACRPCPISSKPEEARTVVGEWPAYRVSQGTVMTMQHRIADCYWQMRLPLIDYGSDVTVALTMYLVNQAKGGDITAPAIKR